MQTSLLLRGDGLFIFGVIGFVGWAVFATTVSLRLLSVEDRAVAPVWG